jgi:hypothetical protein
MGNKNIKDGAKLVGDKFTKGSINDLRDAGYKKADIQAIADRIGNVGEKVQNKMSGWSDSGNGGEDNKPWKTRSVQLPGTSGYRLWTNEDGGVAARNSDIDGVMADVQFGGLQAFRNRMATKQSAEKLNKYLEKTGYSLEGGKGRTVVGYRPIEVERTNYGANPYLSSYQGGLDGDLPGGTEYVAIYSGKTKKKEGKKDEGSEEEERGGGEEGFPGPPSSGSLSPGGRGGSRGGGSSGDGSVRSTVDVPEVQDWNIEEQIAEQDAAAIAEQAAEQALFENVLQSTSNANYSPAITYSPSTAVNPNPSAWENVLSAWDI